MNPRATLFTLAVLACATTAAAQQPAEDLTTLSLSELLQLPVEVVSSASKFAQEVTDAPASVTVVTAEEIRRFGHRTLKDVLDSVRGIYTTDDRNYSYVGVRGFARPGDYNTRVLLLIDGHRTNDPVYDQARIGEDFIVDIDAVERVEVIRGAGSSLYGTSAFFAVVNVVTLTSHDGGDAARVSVDAGTFGTWGGSSSVAHRFDNGGNLFVSGATHRSDGQGRLYIAEFDSPETNFGIARNADGERSGRIFGSYSLGNFTVRGAFSDRDKHVPTAAYDTIFGDTRFVTRDTQGLVDATYEGAFGRGWTGLARASFDHYRYSGDYPFDYGDDGEVVFYDSANVDWLTAELTLNRRVGARHLATWGVEWRQSVRERQFGYDAVSGVQSDVGLKTGTWGAYVQDEFTVLPRVVINGGARIDHLPVSGLHLAPRAAVIYHPRRSSALKLLYGRAFRAPNTYERGYYSVQALMPALQREAISTTEGVWEQYYGRHLRSSVSVYRSEISDLITQQSLGVAPFDELYFANMPGARATGVESEIEGRWGPNVMVRASHARSKAHEASDDSTLTNSPAHVSKLALSVPLMRSHTGVAVEGRYLGSRLTLGRETLPGVFLANVNLLSTALRRGAELSLGVYNIFDQRYTSPAAEEHVEQAIEQYGRTLRARLTFTF